MNQQPCTLRDEMPEKWESLVITRALRQRAVAPIMASGSLRRCRVRNINALPDNSSSCASGTISTLSQNILKLLRSASLKPSKARNSRYVITEIPTYAAASSLVARSRLPFNSETTALVSSTQRSLPLIAQTPLGSDSITFPVHSAAQITKTVGGIMFLGGSSSGEQKLEKVSHLASLRCRKFRKIKQIGCRSGHDVASLFLMIGTLAQEMNDDKIEVKGGHRAEAGRGVRGGGFKQRVMRKKVTNVLTGLFVAVAFGLAACGGGGSGDLS